MKSVCVGKRPAGQAKTKGKSMMIEERMNLYGKEFSTYRRKKSI